LQPFVGRSLGAAGGDVVGCTFDFSLPRREPLQGREQFGGLDLLHALCQQAGVAAGAGVDPHLQGTKHFQFGEPVDQRLFARLDGASASWLLLLLLLLLVA